MSSETQRLGGPPTRRAAEHTYFVGRRLFEAAEIYGVTATDVERLGSGRRKGDSSLDWHGSGPAKLELSRVLINRVIEQRPSREVQARFALYVLDRLPDGGFVLDADDVWRWLKLASDPEDFSQDNSSRSSRRGRLRPPFRRTAQRSTNA
jgi:hypothetical protein